MLINTWFWDKFTVRRLQTTGLDGSDIYVSQPGSGRGVAAVLSLKEYEGRLVREVEVYLDGHFPEETILVRRRFASLKALGESISQFPSVREAQLVRGELRDEEKLIKSLCAFAPSSHLLHIPTRIVAARSFLVAKCHAFSLLSLLVRDENALQIEIRKVIFSIVCTLMAEEVYFSCLESPEFSEEIKRRLADDLISLWESGTDPRAVIHLPALESLWVARDESPPSFGTMDGTSELIRISIDMGSDWQEFLMGEAQNDEARWALEEFLFGLSFEEINQVRSNLNHWGILAVGHDEVRSYLGSSPAYTIAKNTDPRAIYDFYIDRRDAAAFRKRTSAPGPWRTLEEMYLKFRIARE
jgi:hypothetical protein